MGPCWGEADLATKKWFIKGCKNDYSAYGTFVAGEGVEKYYGIGKSNENGDVDFKLLVSSVDAKISIVKPSTYTPDTSFEKGILARIEAAKLTTGRSGQDDSSLAKKQTNLICDGLKYGNPDYVEEAKRRKLMSSDCNKYLDIKTATPEKPSSTTATTKASQPTKDGNFKKRLRELKKLVDEGLITPDEAATKRKEILKEM